ncbi:MAG: MFS transporter [Bryobacterales bacterium]|nr:MFS transporter [Bryobacterales bacterium]
MGRGEEPAIGAGYLRPGQAPSFIQLLRSNRNYRYTWLGQVVSEIGDHFNNVAVFSLAMEITRSGMVVTGVMMARAIPMVMAGPLAGVLLDRMDRKRIMIASDLMRAAVAALFILTVGRRGAGLLYLFSALLMFASPFFTSGRASVLPAIASKEELHTANSLTQTTQWITLTLGAMLGGISVTQFGWEGAFLVNALSFLFSAWAISRLRVASGFRAQRTSLTETEVVRPWNEYMQGLRYMGRTPLVIGIAVINIGWASGGGAAQILFSLFGEIVFGRGAAGIGTIWSFAGLGLIVGGLIGHRLGRRLSFRAYKWTIAAAYVVHGGAYVVFSQMQQYWAALLFIAISRAGVAVSSVLNFAQLLRHVPDEYRGRVFATLESMTWSTMMLSMMGAGLASGSMSPRTIGLWSGVLSSSTALFWIGLHAFGRLPEPALEGVEPEEVEVHGQPTV